MKFESVLANAAIAAKSASYACTSLPTAIPNAVLAADAEVELVPPFASDMGVATVTVGLPKAFSEAADTSTPVANEVPSVTVAVIVPITPRPVGFGIENLPRWSNA